MDKQPLSLVERLLAALGIVKSLLRKAVGESAYKSGLTAVEQVLERGELQQQDVSKYGLRIRPSSTD